MTFFITYIVYSKLLIIIIALFNVIAKESCGV